MTAAPKTSAASASSTATPTHYQVLGVPPTATYDDIKAAFHRQARQVHPDRKKENHDDTCEFRQAQLAWEILRDSTQRQAYDEDLHIAQQREQRKTHGSVLEIARSSLEVAQDEETGETLYVYDCRCGEEVLLDHDQDVQECPGCCFVYKLVE